MFKALVVITACFAIVVAWVYFSSTPESTVVPVAARPQAQPPVTMALPPAHLVNVATPLPMPRPKPTLNTDARLRQAQGKTVRTLSHEASISGTLTDIVAYRLAYNDCDRQHFNALEAKADKTDINVRRERAIRDILARCDGYPETRVVHELKDAEGFGDLAADLLMPSQKHAADSAQAKRLFKRVIESESALLLDYYFRMNLMESYTALLDIEEASTLTSRADKVLTRHAVNLLACRIRGNCGEIAMQDLKCSQHNACTDSLESFANDHIFTSAENRASPFQIEGELNSTVALRTRFERIQSRLQQMVCKGSVANCGS